jgi:uncharacterized protein (DUF302 family)
VAAQSVEGVVSVASAHSVDETVERLQGLLAEKGIKLFATVDHSGEAHNAGLTMPPTKLLIFGSPKAGTPLMLAAPMIALDLPLKLLVAEGADGQVRISYNDPAYLGARYSLPAALQPILSAAEVLARGVAQ